MGSAASMVNDETNESSQRVFFCHECHNFCNVINSQSFSCSYCSGVFTEEVRGNNGFINNATPAISSVISSSTNNNLTEIRNSFSSSEQSDRRNTLSAILRMFEVQLLRDELIENLYRNTTEDPKVLPLTKTMKRKLVDVRITDDQLTQQPCCSVCNEDFIANETLLSMPCTHLFHHNCVNPWFDIKKTCPVCRYELDNNVPSTEELEKYSIENIQSQLLDVSLSNSKNKCNNDDRTREELVESFKGSSKAELASMLQKEIRLEKYADDALAAEKFGNDCSGRTSSISSDGHDMLISNTGVNGNNYDDMRSRISLLQHQLIDSLESSHQQHRQHQRERQHHARIIQRVNSNNVDEENSSDSSSIVGMPDRQSSSFTIGSTYVLRSNGGSTYVSVQQPRLTQTREREMFID